MTALAARAQLEALQPAIGGVEAARIEERRRIGDDLHDEVAQLLFAARLSLDRTLGRPDLQPECAAAIARSRDLLVRADDAIRVVIHGMADPDTAQLDVRLRATAARVAEEFQLPVRVDLDDEAVRCALDLSQTLRDGLVKVAREALTNAAKHAGPCRAVLRLTLGDADRIVLTVADDGRSALAAAPAAAVGGPDDAASGHGGHGLAALRRMLAAQGATLSVRRDVRGTTVSAVAPAPARERPAIGWAQWRRRGARKLPPRLASTGTLASACQNQDA